MLSLNQMAIISIVFTIVSGCRAFYEDTGSAADISQEDFLDPAPGGGCPDGATDPFDNSQSSYVGGDVDILVEVGAATDFRCPYCAMFAGMAKAIFDKPEYRDHVRFYYHHFPLSMHEDALDVHIRAAAVANQSQGDFWELHDEIFENAYAGNSMSVSEIEQWVEDELSVDMDLFQQDVDDPETQQFVEDDKAQAIAMGIDSVPRVIVCGKQLYNWANLEGALDHYLGY